MHPIETKYQTLKSLGGIFEKPCRCVDRGPCRDGKGHYQHYKNSNWKQEASIYWHPEFGAHEVHGLIRDKWAQLGGEWENGLGYPISDQRCVSDEELHVLLKSDGSKDLSICRPSYNRCSEFERGRIYHWSPNNTQYIITVFFKDGRREDERLPQSGLGIFDEIWGWIWGENVLFLGAPETGKSLLARELSGECINNSDYKQTTIEKTGILKFTSKKTGEAIYISEGTDVGGTSDSYGQWENAYKDASYVLYLFNARKTFDEGSKDTIERIKDDIALINAWNEKHKNPKRKLFFIGTHSDELKSGAQIENRISDFRAEFIKKISDGVPTGDFDFRTLLQDTRRFILGSAKINPGHLMSCVFDKRG